MADYEFCSSQAELDAKEMCKVEHDHVYNVSVNPQLLLEKQKYQDMKQKVRMLQQNIRRKDKKIIALEQKLRELQKDISRKTNLHHVVADTFSGMKLEVMKNELAGHGVEVHQRVYSEDIQAFASNLHSISPRAYEYLSNVLSLPLLETSQPLSSNELPSLEVAESEMLEHMIVVVNERELNLDFQNELAEM